MMKNGVTILFVTHEMSTIKAFCERCVYLKKGVIHLDGSAEDLADVYLREIRDEMNKHNMVEQKTQQIFFEKYDNEIKEFKEDVLFSQRKGLFRQGNKAAVVTAFDVINSSGKPLVVADFNERVRLIIFVKFNEDICLSIGYHIRNSKNEEVIGSSFTVENGGKLIDGKKGDGIGVEFSTKLPLMEGDYNITLVVSQPVENDTAVFNDFIENAYLFKVDRRPRIKLWDMVYLENTYKASYFQKI